MRAVQPAVLELARGLVSNGSGHASLVVRLDPPELGPVLVRVVVRRGEVSVTCRTPDLAAVDVLRAQRSDLVEVLRREGMDLSAYDVHGQGRSASEHSGPDERTGNGGARASDRGEGGSAHRRGADDRQVPRSGLQHADDGVEDSPVHTDSTWL